MIVKRDKLNLRDLSLSPSEGERARERGPFLLWHSNTQGALE